MQTTSLQQQTVYGRENAICFRFGGEKNSKKHGARSPDWFSSALCIKHSNQERQAFIKPIQQSGFPWYQGCCLVQADWRRKRRDKRGFMIFLLSLSHLSSHPFVLPLCTCTQQLAFGAVGALVVFLSVAPDILAALIAAFAGCIFIHISPREQMAFMFLILLTLLRSCWWRVRGYGDGQTCRGNSHGYSNCAKCRDAN